MLAQVALRRELNVVYAELFGAGGAEIFFRPAEDYGIVDRKVSFGKLKDISADRGEIVLGIRSKNNPIELNPVQNKTYILKGTEDLIVLVREEAA